MASDPTRYYQSEEVARTYDQQRFSSVAGRVFNALEKRSIRAAFRGLRPDATIADVPCGTGRLAEALLRDGFEVVGVDISDAMLNVARTRLAAFGDRFKTRVMDMLDGDCRSDVSYDAVLCARILMHFPLEKQRMFLANAAKLSRGRVVFTQSLSSPYQSFRRSVKHLLGHQPSVNYPVSATDLTGLVRSAGMSIVRRIRPCAPISEEIIVVCAR